MELIQYITNSLKQAQPSTCCQNFQKLPDLEYQTNLQILQTSKHGDIVINQTIDENYDNILVKFVVIQQKIIKCENQILRQLLNRFFLKENRIDKRYVGSVDMRSGQIRVNEVWNLPGAKNQIGQKSSQLFQYLRAEMYQDIVKLIKKILIFIDPNNYYEEQNQSFALINNELELIKSCIQASSYYSWHILTQQSARKQNVKVSMYQAKKKAFLQMIQLQKPPNEKAQTMQLISTSSQNLGRKSLIYVMNKNEDQQTNQQYLKKTFMIVQNSQQINQIKVDNQNLSKLLQEGEIKIKYTTDQDQKERQIKIHSTKYTKNQDLEGYAYQKQIFKKLYKPNGQFLGLLKYYFIKGKAKETEQYCYSSLTNVKLIKNFLNSNQATLSIFTKLDILLQINNCIRYLRDNQITYHNLIPKNIAVKKGLVIKLFNFSNSYHLNIRNNVNSHHKPFLNKYPYVSNFVTHTVRTAIEQKADVFSMGIISYEILNKKSALNIKQSYFYKNNMMVQEIYQKYRNNLISLEGIGDQYPLNYIKLLNNFIFKALSHHRRRKVEDDLDDDRDYQNYTHQVHFQERPYMDWVTIVLRKILNAIESINI